MRSHITETARRRALSPDAHLANQLPLHIPVFGFDTHGACGRTGVARCATSSPWLPRGSSVSVIGECHRGVASCVECLRHHKMSVVKALSLDAVTFVEIDLHNRIAFDLVSNGCEIWIAVIV
jgi:hypothetical protein